MVQPKVKTNTSAARLRYCRFLNKVLANPMVQQNALSILFPPSSRQAIREKARSNALNAYRLFLRPATRFLVQKPHRHRRSDPLPLSALKSHDSTTAWRSIATTVAWDSGTPHTIRKPWGALPINLLVGPTRHRSFHNEKVRFLKFHPGECGHNGPYQWGRANLPVPYATRYLRVA